MATEKVNGVRVHYGPRFVEDKAPSTPSTMGMTKQLVVSFNYDDLPAADADDAVIQVIPAGARIVSAVMTMTVTGTTTSTTSTVDVGLQELDGTEIDNNGLIAAAAWDAAAGVVYTGAGADVGEIPSLTADGQIVVTPSVSDLLTGSAKIVVEYVV